jgi:4'-phosphopantetheinyl transferase
MDKNDLVRADRFHFEEDRFTWLFCHTLLRLIVSAKLGITSSDVKITIDRNNKPWLEGNALLFNIAHTREAFVFAISDSVRVGIDIEKVDRNIDFRSIIRNFFSAGEIKFIIEDPDYSRDRFFLLWTRKEALLKALGTGIIEKLPDVEVFRKVNILDRRLFNNVIDPDFFCDHFIYSEKIMDYFLSLALPCRAKIIFHQLNAENIKYYWGD